MKQVFLLSISLALVFYTGYGQSLTKLSIIDRTESETHLYFLASDEMRGRNIGTVESNIAARYIAEQFRKYGPKPTAPNGSYFQPVTFTTTSKPQSAQLTLLGQTFSKDHDLAYLNGPNGSVKAPVLLLKSYDEIKTADLKGKIVVTPIGGSRREHFIRRQQIMNRGGLGWIELYHKKQGIPWPWSRLQPFVENMTSLGMINEQIPLPHVIITDTLNAVFDKLLTMKNSLATIDIAGANEKEVISYNVIGKIEGSDPNLKNEFIVLGAHYDQIGIGKPSPSQDSINNGARDNAVGVTGLINAAAYFGRHPTKRSLLFIAFTGEEKGLFGSKYYVNHPLIPLNQCVYNLDIDNSGYNDTTKVTIIGNGRTNTDDLMRVSAREVGLEAINDPVPDQNFVERSDSFSFMEKGIPALQFGMGLTAMDEQISKYYHRVEDQVETLNLNYIHKYLCGFILMAETLGNWNQEPAWSPGDKFEKLGEQLYKNKN